MGVQLEHPLGDVDQPPLVDHRLAGRVGDVVLEVAVVAVADPERQGAQPPLRLEPLGDPGALRADRAGQVLDQLVEEALARLGGGALHDLAQGILVERRIGHGLFFYFSCFQRPSTRPSGSSNKDSWPTPGTSILSTTILPPACRIFSA